MRLMRLRHLRFKMLWYEIYWARVSPNTIAHTEEKGIRARPHQENLGGGVSSDQGTS